MPRKKKEVVETPVEMKEDAMNLPEEKDTFKKVNCGTAKVNCREKPEGEIMFTVDNLSKVHAIGEVDLNGVKWTQISGYIRSDLLIDFS